MDSLLESLNLCSDVIGKVEYLNTYQKLDDYKPYPYQLEFHHAQGYQTNELAKIRGLMAGNQVGKTKCAATEVAMHLTGNYPDWWDGHRFLHPVVWICGANTNEQTRDVVQGELFGDPADDSMLGTGAIPKWAIGERVRKPGVPNAFDSVMIRHASGGMSKIMFRAYEQGAKKHMGLRIDGGWMDEEPPSDIYAQYLRGTIATHGIIMLTFTPENGITQLVYQLLHELHPGMALIRAEWKDAPHLTEARQKEILAQFSVHEREMRSRGVPMMGSGLIFPIPDEDIAIDPFDIPKHWAKIIGVDFGWDHPFAIACLAHDRDKEEVFLYHTFKESHVRVPVGATRLKQLGGNRIPVVWPHDGMIHDKNSGKPLAELYRVEGVDGMLSRPFSNPPSPGQPEGSGGQGVEVGLIALHNAMEEGRFKVFKTCADFFSEKAIYHRASLADGKVKIVKQNDDVISATRYAFQSLRFADADMPVVRRARKQRKGLRMW